MSEPTHQPEADGQATYSMAQPHNPVSLEQLQQLAHQAQQLQDGTAAILPLGQTMPIEGHQFGQAALNGHDLSPGGAPLSTAELLRHVGMASGQGSTGAPQVNLSDFQAVANAYAAEIPQQQLYQASGDVPIASQAQSIPAPSENHDDSAAVPPPADSQADASALYKPPVSGLEGIVHDAVHKDGMSVLGVPPPVQQQEQPPPPAQIIGDGQNTVLAAKILTESDVKHSRAILPRIAVENNLPFLLGYRTYGLVLPDPEGRRWEFTIKSWANGRADRTPGERKKDRRVYVVEQMANFLAKNKLVVGDVIGFVVVDGHLQVHCQTHELRAWIERPTYGAPTLISQPEPVPAKCSVLEDIPEDDSVHRQCMRSERCSKPDGHPGFCVGRQDGQRARNTQARLKLTYWPPPSGDMINAVDPSIPIMEIPPAAMPSSGVFLAYRVPVPGHPDTVELPPGSLIKIPIACAREGCLKLTVTGPPGQQHDLIARALLDETPAPIEQDSPDAAVRLNPPGRRVTWQLSGLATLHAAHACDMGDEVCIERQGGGFAVSKVPSDQLLTMPGRPMPLNPSPTVGFGELLCQRAQGCMKAVNHTGFCSGHRGFKRRADGEEIEGGAPKKRRSEPKRKGAKAKATAADETWLPSPGMPADTPGVPQRWTRDAPHVDTVAMIPPADVVPPIPAPSKHVEVNDAADMLLALSGGGQEMGTDTKPPAVAQAQVPPVDKVGVLPEVPMVPAVPPGPANGAPQANVMHTIPAEHAHVPLAEVEDDGGQSYLQLLQNAMTNLSRDEGLMDGAPPPPPS